MKKFGLIGEKLGHSFSPFIHGEILKYINADGEYSLLEYDKNNVSKIIGSLKGKKYSGVNVTIPYKTDIMKYVDDVSYEAKKIAAVNTIHFIKDRTIGYNTDYFGFGMLLNHNKIDIKNKTILILGTGGVSRAVNQYLIDNHAKSIEFCSRNANKSKTSIVAKAPTWAHDKYNDYKIYGYEMLDEIDKTDIVINCTPVGMFKDKDNSPIKQEYLSKFDVAIDLIYNPMETIFIKQAKLQGLKTANGLYMLVAQAIKAQEIWNDIKIEDNVIDKVYDLMLEHITMQI